MRRLVHKAAAGGASALAVAAVIAGSASASLPDGRAYEMVSPASKNGTDVIAESSKTQVALDGDRVSFHALGGFGDVRGTSVDVQYLSTRDGAPGTSGWSTHAISPRDAAGTFASVAFGNSATFEAAFTSDLGSAIYRAWRPLTDSPNEDGVSNLYRLDGLHAGEPAKTLLTRAVAPLVWSFPLPEDPFRLVTAPAFAAASHDLSHVIFESPWHLTGDANIDPGLFRSLYEYVDGVGVRPVGRIPTSPDTVCDDVRGPACADAASSQVGLTPGVAFYSARMIAADGQRIVFQVPGGSPFFGTPLSGALYMRIGGTTTVQLNASEKTSPDAPGDAQAWDMTPDGQRVFFTTSEGLVNGDDDGARDLYMYDATAGAGAHLSRLSVSETANPANVTGVVGASDDGRYVYFISNFQLVAGEPAITTPGLYLWHDGRLAFLGSFDDTVQLTAINTPGTTWNFATQLRTARVSPDGRHLLFMARSGAGFRGHGGFAGFDQGSSSCTYDGDFPECRELYVYSADTNRLACASCNELTGVAGGDAITDPSVGVSGSIATQHVSTALSADGRRVFFSSNDALVPQDINGKWDAYEYDVPSGTVHLISSGKSTADSYFLEASANGDDVFFVTRERLVGWDTDDNYDLYDARVNGGFPEPSPAVPACNGDTCRAALSAQPAASGPASAPFRGKGDAPGKLAKHRRCRGRAVLRRVKGKRRCVRRPSHRRSGRAVRNERSGK